VVDFADQVAALTETFPRGYGFLVDQLNRAALSIATNLAEGNGRFTKPDRKNFFTIARGCGTNVMTIATAVSKSGSKFRLSPRLIEGPVLAVRSLYIPIAHGVGGEVYAARIVNR
jgi:four helix bundle protein